MKVLLAFTTSFTISFRTNRHLMLAEVAAL